MDSYFRVACLYSVTWCSLFGVFKFELKAETMSVAKVQKSECRFSSNSVQVQFRVSSGSVQAQFRLSSGSVGAA